MINIQTKSYNLSFEYNNIKLLTEYDDNFVRELIDPFSKIQISNQNIKYSNIVYISKTTKLSDLMSFTKTSPIFQKINSLTSEFSILNEESIARIAFLINSFYGYEFIGINEGDINKLIPILFEMMLDKYVNFDTLKAILSNNLFNDKKLIIIDDLDDVNVEKLFSFLNDHYFLILSKNPIDKINMISSFEILGYVSNSFEILDFDKLINFIEKEMSSIFNQEIFNKIKKSKYSFELVKLEYIVRKFAEF